VDLRRFLADPIKSGINIVEWSVLYASVLDFRYTFALYKITTLNVCDLVRKMMPILGFSAAVIFRGQFEEIGIAKVLLNTKPCRMGKFRDVGFSTSEKVWRDRKKERK